MKACFKNLEIAYEKDHEILEKDDPQIENLHAALLDVEFVPRRT